MAVTVEVDSQEWGAGQPRIRRAVYITSSYPPEAVFQGRLHF